MSLQGKVALVTGAAGSIGAAVARRLCADGAHVVLIDRAPEALEAAAEPLGDSATTAVLDLTDAAAIESTVASLAERFGHLDVLVNNAGVLSNNKVAAAGLDEWRGIMAVNLDAAFLMTKAVLPSMRASRWGRIVMMSSFSAKSGGITYGTAYSTSKAALVWMTFAVARETTR
jgi:3-oxoacyl-[acyl-carrier protein] reductase